MGAILCVGESVQDREGRKEGCVTKGTLPRKGVSGGAQSPPEPRARRLCARIHLPSTLENVHAIMCYILTRCYSVLIFFFLLCFFIVIYSSISNINAGSILSYPAYPAFSFGISGGISKLHCCFSSVIRDYLFYSAQQFIFVVLKFLNLFLLRPYYHTTAALALRYTE